MTGLSAHAHSLLAILRTLLLEHGHFVLERLQLGGGGFGDV